MLDIATILDRSAVIDGIHVRDEHQQKRGRYREILPKRAVILVVFLSKSVC